MGGGGAVSRFLLLPGGRIWRNIRHLHKLLLLGALASLGTERCEVAMPAVAIEGTADESAAPGDFHARIIGDKLVLPKEVAEALR